jgi:uncharacterized protein (TIGR03083 family)
MSRLADRTVMSLRDHHDRMEELIATLDGDQLVLQSGASEWRVCDVLSHLGSGSEIMLRPVRAAAEGVPVSEGDNQAVWDRWNAMSPPEQASGYVEQDAVLVEALEALTPEQRDAVIIDLGSRLRRRHVAQSVPLEVAAGMRLSEVAQHTWDVLVAFDPDAGVDHEAAAVMLTLLAYPLRFMLKFTSMPDVLSEPTEVGAGAWALVIDAGVRLVPAGTNPTATFTGAPEAFYRLMGGRLGQDHTPAGVTVTGNVTLDDVRRVFPGF